MAKRNRASDSAGQPCIFAGAVLLGITLALLFMSGDQPALSQQTQTAQSSSNPKSPQAPPGPAGQASHGAGSQSKVQPQPQLQSQSQAQPQSQLQSHSPVKLYGQVNALLNACYSAGVEINSTTLPATIKKVRMGSAAFYSGLQDKDQIVQGSMDSNHLNLTIKRGSATYGVSLPTDASALVPMAVPKATFSGGGTVLSSGTEKTINTKDPAWKKLKNYDIVMLIDQSGSMADTIDANGTTKWDWCANQLTSFASEALINTGRRFTIITFNGLYHIRRDCGPEEVHQTFTRNTPMGATDLATPMDFVLKDYMSSARTNPLLIVVLTDGMPARPDFVENSIVKTTQQMSSAEQIKVVFFEIGNDADGAAVIRLLDHGLVSEGARYDIVESYGFEHLQQVGLKLALYDAFNANSQTRSRSSAPVGLSEELEAVRRQIREARARNAENPSSR